MPKDLIPPIYFRAGRRRRRLVEQVSSILDKPMNGVMQDFFDSQFGKFLESRGLLEVNGEVFKK